MSEAIERHKLAVEMGQLQQNKLTTELRAMQLTEDVARNQEALTSIVDAITSKQREIDTFGQLQPEAV